LDVLVDFLRLVDDDAPQIQASLVGVQILGGLDGEALLPEAIDVGLALLVGGPHVLDDLLELLEALQVLNEGVGTTVGFPEQ
jgi:ABC-type enterochelin transport system permease subunit